MMTTAMIVNAALSLVLVICLILLTAQLFRWWQNRRQELKKFTPAAPGGPHPAAYELDVVSSRAIDFKRKLVLVRRGDRLHLLLCTEGRDIVVETGIPFQVPHETASSDAADQR